MRAKSTVSFLFISMAAVACQGNKCLDECIDRSYVHEYGVTVDGDHWINSGQNGQVISFLRNGVRLTQTYSDAKLNGTCTYTFPHSEQLQCVEVYADDQLISQVTYGLSGAPVKSIIYDSPEVWTTTVWYETGNPKSIERYERSLVISGEYYNALNQKDSWVCHGNGERIVRDDAGNFVCLETIAEGVLTQRTTYYPNGTPKEICAYVDNIPHGERKTFYPGGEPMTIEAWHNGEQTGTTIVFQEGEKYAEIPYLSNRKNGLERRFRDGCVVTQEVTWLDDKMHGPTFTYVGDSVQTDWFFKGRLTSRSNFESFAIPRSKE